MASLMPSLASCTPKEYHPLAIAMCGTSRGLSVADRVPVSRIGIRFWMSSRNAVIMRYVLRHIRN